MIMDYAMDTPLRYNYVDMGLPVLVEKKYM